MNIDDLTLYHDHVKPGDTPLKKKKPYRLKQWDDAEIETPVTYARRVSYYRIASIRRSAAEQEGTAGNPVQARRRPGRPRRAG
jgi:hypothetical protein